MLPSVTLVEDGYKVKTFQMRRWNDFGLRYSTEDDISLESNSDTDSDKEDDVTDTNCAEVTYLTHNWLTVPIVHRLAGGC